MSPIFPIPISKNNIIFQSDMQRPIFVYSGQYYPQTRNMKNFKTKNLNAFSVIQIHASAVEYLFIESLLVIISLEKDK